MKVFKLISFVFLTTCSLYSVQAQKYTKYWSTGSDLIFSFANTSYNQAWGETKNPMRFTGVLNFKSHTHFNFSQKSGMYIGFAIRNVGIITHLKNPSTELSTFFTGSTYTDLKIKQRVYTVGIPIAFKYGNMDIPFYIFGGGEAGFAFHYKEKFFSGDDKLNGQKRTAFFSDRTNIFQPSLFAGIQFPAGGRIEFRYYMDDLLNTDYTNSRYAGTNNKPYEGVKSQMFYVSVGLMIHHVKMSMLDFQEQEINAKAY